VSEPTKDQLEAIKSRRREIYLLLDNIYDTYNVGGCFRLADAVGGKKMYLCGRTECPPNPRISKASVGTDKWVDWEYGESALEQIRQLTFNIKHLTVVGIEQSEKSIPLNKAKLEQPLIRSRYAPA